MMDDKYIIINDKIIRNAIEKIEKNTKGFVFVVNHSNELVGIITDGDIRRGLLNGLNLDNCVVDVMSYSFAYISETSSFEEVITLFQSPKINVLPIVNGNKELTNFITKKHLHIMLMSDYNFDLSFNFDSLDEMILEYEVYNRPWGMYKTTFQNQYSKSKIIIVLANESLSLQEHKKRDEHWVIIKGKGLLTIGESQKNVYGGDYIYIPKGCKHRIENSGDETLLITEVQLGDYFGEDDIIRYSDNYGRK